MIAQVRPLPGMTSWSQVLGILPNERSAKEPQRAAQDPSLGHSCRTDQDPVLGSCLLPGLGLAVVAVWGVNRQMENLSLAWPLK